MLASLPKRESFDNQLLIFYVNFDVEYKAEELTPLPNKLRRSLRFHLSRNADT